MRFSSGRAGTSHPSRDTCPLWERRPAAWGFCTGLGGRAGTTVRTQASPCQSGPGKWSSARGASRQLPATQHSSTLLLPVLLPSPRKERRERTTEHCTRGRWGLAVCFGFDTHCSVAWVEMAVKERSAGMWSLIKKRKTTRHFLKCPKWHLLAQLFFEASSYHQLQDGDFDVIRVESVSTKSGKINKAPFRNKIVHVKFDF